MIYKQSLGSIEIGTLTGVEKKFSTLSLHTSFGFLSTDRQWFTVISVEM